MMLRTLFAIVTMVFVAAFIAQSFGQDVQDFRDFQVSNAGSDLFDYLVDVGPPALAGILIFGGVYALSIWWNHDSRSKELGKPSARYLLRTGLLVLALAAGTLIGLQNWLPRLLVVAGLVAVIVARGLGFDPADRPAPNQEQRSH